MGWGVNLSAGDYPEAVNKAIDNFIFGLRLDNTGVRESAIINVMELKLNYPELEYEPVADVLDSIAVAVENPVIQRKAYVAANFLRHPEWFSWIKKRTDEENVAFFRVLSMKIEGQGKNVATS